MQVTVLHENARGCGYRHSGKDGYGLYLIGDGILLPCERLPFPLGHCPTCGEGIKFSRGFTWILPSKLLAEDISPICFFSDSIGAVYPHDHKTCLMCHPSEEKQGLMFVGDRHYSPDSFMRESKHMGVSKRISCIPRGFEVGTHVVYLAHNKAVTHEDEPHTSMGIFMAFKPKFLDIVVDTEDVEKLPPRAVQLANKFGDVARIVKIQKIEQTTFLEDNEDD